MKRSICTCLTTLILSLSLALGVSRPAQGQEHRLRFDLLSITNGLSQNTVNTILQDRLGFIWIGTSDGLNRFDGYTFTIYRHDHTDPSSLSDNTILSLFEDSQGTLWVGTAAGLDSFDPATLSFRHTGGASFTNVQTLAEDHSRRLWIGTQSQGVWVMNLTTGVLEQFRHNPQDPGSLASDSVYEILVTRPGEIWIATDSGVEHFLPAQAGFEHYRSNRTNPNSPTSSRVRSLLEDASGALWIGTDGGGLNRLNPETGAFTFYLNASQDPESLGDNRVWDILEDQLGTLWLATPSGLEGFDPEARRFTHYRHNPSDPDSLGGSHLLTLFEDRSGAIWIGTQGAGLSLYRPAAHRFGLYQIAPFQPGSPPGAGLQSNVIQAILEDHLGYLWLGGPESNLSRLDQESGAWTHFSHDALDPHSLTSGGVTSLAEDSQGRLWIATFGGGLDSFDPTSGQFDHYRYVYGDPHSLGSNSIANLLVTRSGDLWVATMDAGLSRLDSSAGHFQHFRHDPADPNTLGSDRVITLFEDQSGALWIGTHDAGLSRFDLVSSSFRHFRTDPSNPNSLNSDQVLSLAEYPAGVLWIGTKAGLNRLDLASGTILHYQASDGLPSETVNCILPDGEGALWIATTNGLARFDPSDGTFRSYTTADGLQSPEFLVGSCFKSPSGQLYFGGVQGFNAFYPAQAAAQAAPPAVAITAVHKNNQLTPGDYASGAALQLSYRDETVLFEFTAFDFNSTGGTRYTYKMEGFDEEWVNAGERHFVSYTNLGPGNYTFHVRAANRDGVWNETGASLPVTIAPALWETAWFRLVVALLTAAAFYGGYRLRLGAIQRRNLALERRVAELNQEVEVATIAAERSRMARDLHDSVTQSIYSLVLLAEAGLRTLEPGVGADTAPPESRLSEAHATIARLGEIAQQALQEMRLMVYQLRQPTFDQTGLAGALDHRLEAVERRAGLQARLIVEGTPYLPQPDEQELYSLAQEALNNALKHSGAGAVTVRLSETSGYLSLEIRDDGRGFDPARVPQGGFGLQSMRQRAEKLGGTLEIDSAPGRGARITFTRSTGDSSWQKISAS